MSYRNFFNNNYYDGAQDYNPKLFSGMSHGRFDPRNLFPPDNLSQDMGASNYVAPPPVYPGQRNIHEGFGTADVSSTFKGPEPTGIIQTLKNKFSGLTTPMMALLQSQKNNPEENFGMNYYAGSLKDGRVNRNPAFNLHGDLNVASGFGKGLGAAGDKRIAKIKETIAGFADQWGNLKESDEAAYNAKLAAHKEKLRQFTIQNQRYKTGLLKDSPPDETIKETITVDGPNVHGGDGNKGGGGYQDQGGYSTQGGFTGKADPASGGARAHHGSDWADGGRIGYNRGRVVNPGGYAGEEFEEFEDENTLEFMRDQGIPYGEMAETSPFEMRINELMDEGMSWQEAYEIASQEFATAEGGGESFNEEGIASLV